MSKYSVIIAFIITMLALFDTFNTIHMIKYGFDIEDNFIMLWVLNNFNVAGFLFIKLATTLFVSLMVMSYWNDFKIAQFGAYLVIGVYSPLVFTQLKTILEVSSNI